MKLIIAFLLLSIGASVQIIPSSPRTDSSTIFIWNSPDSSYITVLVPPDTLAKPKLDTLPVCKLVIDTGFELNMKPRPVYYALLLEVVERFESYNIDGSVWSYNRHITFLTTDSAALPSWMGVFDLLPISPQNPTPPSSPYNPFRVTDKLPIALWN